MTSQTIVAYIGERDESGLRVVNTWCGDKLGTCRFTSSWPVRSCIGSTMYQIRATIGGIAYNGRGFGTGMSVVLRRAKS